MYSCSCNHCNVLTDTKNFPLRGANKIWRVDLTESGTFQKTVLKLRFGRIIFISSIVGYTGNPGQANYSASKSALTGLTKSIALEVAARGITCNLIAPGFISTPMTDKLTDDQKNKIIVNIPVNRLGHTDDISSGCVYLASDEASFVTGTTLHINGGMGMF